MVTLEEAVDILNSRKHNGEAAWKAIGSEAYGSSVSVSCGKRFASSLTVFEAIAIAEKYQRDFPLVAREDKT